MPEPITIVGGGLAGLTLGIGLLQTGTPVTLWESGHYPRHRVCGEFISGDGLQSLSRLGLLPGLREAGMHPVATALFVDGFRSLPPRSLPAAGLSLSRWILDDWLAREFSRLGGELKSGVRWTGTYGAGIVNATGRRPEPVSNGPRLFGLKVHAHALPMNADLEMHLGKSGYIGLCRLADGAVNVCGLFRTPTPIPDLGQRWREYLGGSPDSTLHQRLSRARLEEDSFCCVAGLGLTPHRATERHECCLGDALTMIPPVTGNGMSMALESAEIAVEPLARFSRGELPWNRARERIALACDLRFAPRLRAAALLEWALFRPAARSALWLLARHSNWIWNRIFAGTR